MSTLFSKHVNLVHVLAATAAFVILIAYSWIIYTYQTVYDTASTNTSAESAALNMQKYNDRTRLGDTGLAIKLLPGWSAITVNPVEGTKIIIANTSYDVYIELERTELPQVYRHCSPSNPGRTKSMQINSIESAVSPYLVVADYTDQAGNYQLELWSASNTNNYLEDPSSSESPAATRAADLEQGQKAYSCLDTPPSSSLVLGEQPGIRGFVRSTKVKVKSAAGPISDPSVATTPGLDQIKIMLRNSITD